MSDRFDVIVIGGGHAGAEAARIVARGGARVALVTMIAEAIGRMSCNPAIGGLAKGHLVREIDAMGGLMGEAADRAGIQFKVLNRSKGPAVHGPRVQCDRDLYAATVRTSLENEPNLSIVEGLVSDLQIEANAVAGVSLQDGRSLAAPAVIVTTGTFLRSLMHSGEKKTVGGRFGEPSAETLSTSLAAIGLRLGRLKTGTPPRVAKSSADFTRMTEAPGDETPRPFSILTDSVFQPQVLCWLTHTDERIHELIRANLHRAPMYSGQIEGTGPRYCPSIEDKVVRFAEKAQHHVFVEPEGLEHPWLYLNGISTSLPPDVQEDVVHGIPGLERAVITRYGYAVEYDFVNPEQLDPTLQVRGIRGLFLAGQINGTSGYEEAAGQGLIAGINALQLLRDAEPLILRRDQAYLGVMIDDLVTLGTEEPYRMFTSRAEHRLLLGCDTVYERLTPVAAGLGLVDEERLQRVDGRRRRTRAAEEAAGASEIVPSRDVVEWFGSLGLSLAGPATVAKLLQRPGFPLEEFLDACREKGLFDQMVGTFASLSEEERDAVVNRARYAGYIEKQRLEAEKIRQDEDLRIPSAFSYRKPGLSIELIDKLERVRPVSLGQAGRIPGMTPAAIAILRLHLRRGGARGARSIGADSGLPRAAADLVGEDQPDRA
ncbi:MAG: tRNA uridine-5-carboxymethylaminomethyl(34) synthesis enzyme MnmG [Thermoanaerobaculia bacterium]